ncbi:MAG TPA: cupin domain-containing protein [Thermomicrobiales bacterium]|nr:cupin domain-containing protein [Thermomicrobiales bacterium]
MNVFRASELAFIETPGANATAAIATPSRGAEDVSIVRQRQQPGGGNPAHFHDREEVMIVTRGSVAVTLGGESVMLGSGDTLIIPARTAHQLSNAGDDEAEWLLVAPAGVGFFREDGERADPLWAR